LANDNSAQDDRLLKVTPLLTTSDP
jgi:hypothetical protein